MSKKEKGGELENFDDLFQDDTTIPESAWFQFENVGDAIQGELTMEPYDKESNFGTQKIYVVKRTSDGKEFNVALKHTTHALNIRQLAGIQVGDLVAFRFKEIVDTGKGNPCKSIEVRLRRKTA